MISGRHHQACTEGEGTILSFFNAVRLQGKMDAVCCECSRRVTKRVVEGQSPGCPIKSAPSGTGEVLHVHKHCWVLADEGKKVIGLWDKSSHFMTLF